MIRDRTNLEFDIRPYRSEDEPRVLELLLAALGPGPVGERTPPFFRWKHLENPAGSSFMLVAEVDGRLAGLRAFMRWRFRSGERDLHAVTAVDTATHPDFQGHGIFSTLTRAALDALEGEVDLVFNTPNEKSLPGYLKMGWHLVGRVPISVRVRRPLRFAANARSLRRPSAPEPDSPAPSVAAPMAAEVLTVDLGALLESVGDPQGRIETTRDLRYLQWRYGSAPGLDYRAVLQGQPGRPEGLAILRIRRRGRSWETSVVELITAGDDIASAGRLLRSAARAAPVEHVVAHLPKGSAGGRAALRSGYVAAPHGVTFVVRTLRDGLRPDPTSLDGWALSLGDLEVF